MVTVKFKVTTITENEHWDKSKGSLKTILLDPVYDKDPESENGRFFAATPGGNINLPIVNANASKEFEVGAEYFVTFKKA